jgi:hypothetical protein
MMYTGRYMINLGVFVVSGPSDHSLTSSSVVIRPVE